MIGIPIIAMVCVMTPAQHIIDLFGGVGALHKATGTPRSTIYRWTWPKERGGTDGHIPRWHHDDLLKAAEQNGLTLAPIDLVQPPTDEGRAA